MDKNIQEPTIGGSITEMYFKVDEKNKVIDKAPVANIVFYENPGKEADKIVGENPITITLIPNKEEEQEK